MTGDPSSTTRGRVDRRAALVLALALAVAVLAWSLLGERSTRVEPVTHSPAAASEQGTTAAPAELEPLEAQADTGRHVATDATAAAATPTTAAAEAPQPLEPGGLHVRVVDARGVPVADVGVVLEMEIPGMGSDDRGRATSRAPDGLARIALDGLARMRRQVEGMDMKVRFSVLAEVASATPVRSALDDWPREGQELELRLPASGSFVVRALDVEGQPFQGRLQVAWWWLPADVAADDPDAGYERVAGHMGESEEGVVRVDGVGPGLALQVQASTPGLVYANRRGIPGPTRPGEVVEVVMQLGPEWGAAVFRVVDQAGRPVANEHFRCELFTDPEREWHPAAGPRRGHGFSLESDEAGRCRKVLTPGESAHEQRIDVIRKARDTVPQEDALWSLGSLWLPRRVAPAEVVDLGDLVLEPARVLAEGHVVDTRGAVIAGADLYFSERFGSTPQHRWYNISTGRMRTGSDGHFRLRGVRTPRELGVEVSCEGYESRTLHGLTIGERALLIELEPEQPPAPRGTLKLRVLLDEGVPFMQLLLYFRNEQGAGGSPDWYAGAPLEFDYLSPGTYDVWIKTRKGGFELGRVSGVVVEEGQTTEDARLLPFDLRGKARLVSLRFVRPDGSPWRRHAAGVRAAGTGAGFELETDDEGLASFILPTQVTAIDVGIDREHIKRVTIEPSDEPLRVEFED